MRKLWCLLFGHIYRKVAYANNKFDVWICPICGKKYMAVRSHNYGMERQR